MNKLFTKIVGATLGFAMAIGVGVAVATNKEVAPAHAVDVNGTGNIVFEDEGLTNSEKYSSFTISNSNGDVATVAFGDGSNDGKYYDTGKGIRIYSGGKVTITAKTGNVTSATLTFSGSSYTGTFSANNGTYSLSSTTGSWSGMTNSFVLTNNASSGHARIQSITVTTAAAASNPTVTVDSAVTINTGKSSGVQLTATTELISDALFEWTTSDTNITLENADTATVTIKPNSNIGGSATVSLTVLGTNTSTSTEVEIEKEVAVTLETPKTVAQALLMSGSEGVYTKGIISQIDAIDTSSFFNATYYISDDGTTSSDQLEIFRGKYLDNTDFTSSDLIAVGDTVVVYGNITTYQATIEYAAGNYIVYHKAPARLTLAPSTIEVTLGTDEEVAATPVSFDSGTIVYGFDTDDCATLSYSGNTLTVHGDAVGSHTFTITASVGDVVQASAELEVNVVNPYPKSINRTGYASFNDEQTFAEGTGSVKITYSDSTTATKHLGDAGVKLLISDAEVAANTPASSYIGSNSAKITYTEGDYTVSTNVYTLNVNAALEVTSFEGIPDGGYLIIDSSDPLHSATITVNYKSLNGEPELSIVSSNPTKLPVTFDEEDNVFEGTTGVAEFTITAGNTIGQYSVTASVTYGNRTETKSFSINVRGEAPATGGGNYEKITALSDLTTGNYVIAVDDGSVYGMTRSLSGGKYSFSDALTVTDDKISDTDGNSINYYLSVSGTGASRTVTIKNPGTNSYVYYVSSTNLGEQNSSYNWTVTAETNDSFRFASGTSGRGLYARTGTTNKFGGYSTSNVGNGEYYDVTLFKYVEGGAETSFDLISEFVSNYMHMSDVSIGNNNDTGACKGNDGYYLTAKRAWNDMTDSYEGTDDLQEVFEGSFEDAYARYIKWSIAMNDAAPFDGNDDVHTKIRASALNIFGFNDGSSSAATIIVIISMISITAFAGYMILRKKKEQ